MNHHKKKKKVNFLVIFGNSLRLMTLFGITSSYPVRQIPIREIGVLYHIKILFLISAK